MEREEAHTCTNHPIINNVHGVGGRPPFSEGWGVRWGAGDQQFGPGQQLSSLLWASPLLQLAPRLLQLLCTEKTDERRPISLSPAQMVLKQSAACYQLMRREQLLWTIKWKDYVWLYSIWILKREKKNNHKYNHYYCTALFLGNITFLFTTSYLYFSPFPGQTDYKTFLQCSTHCRQTDFSRLSSQGLLSPPSFCSICHLYHYSQLFVLFQLFIVVKLLYKSAKSSCLMKIELVTLFLCLNSFNFHRIVIVEISTLLFNESTLGLYILGCYVFNEREVYFHRLSWLL